ncbi:DUF2335 domain-containing protein [Leuconostoc pseudomesenteroides]|uniref:DUF2335 domain-containing protein n=1 Tax=Leuconostoc pseudomesenteroides TaxID=33968 RepID=UPI0039EA6DD9
MAADENRNNGSKMTLQQRYSGPLPPASELGRYESIEPGLANRIVEMAEKQAAHRQDMERQEHELQAKALKSDTRDSLFGLIFAFVIAFGGLSLAGYMIYLGHMTGGIFTIFVVIGSIVASFVYGTHNNKK